VTPTQPESQTSPRTRIRRWSAPTLGIRLAVAMPLVVLVLPVVFGLPAMTPLLHESAFYPGFSRAFLVAVPLGGLVLANLVVVATGSTRSALVAIGITTALAVLIVLGAIESVAMLDGLGGGD